MYGKYYTDLRSKIQEKRSGGVKATAETQVAESEARRALGQRQAESQKERFRDKAENLQVASNDDSMFGWMESIYDSWAPEEAAPAKQEPQRFAPAGAYAAHDKEAFNRVVSKLVKRGMPQHIAEGFAMNIEDESGFNPVINEVAPTVKGSRGGYGLYQLTGPRRVAFEKFAAENGIRMDSPEAQEDAQLDFAMYELSGPESRAWERIQTATNSGEAAAFFARDFLRPAKEHLDRRVAKYTGGRNADYVLQPKKRPLVTKKGT